MARTKASAIKPILTPRQIDIVRRIILGEQNKEIAWYIGLSQRTVTIYISDIYRRVRVPNRIGLMMWAQLNKKVLARPASGYALEFHAVHGREFGFRALEFWGA